MKRFWENIDPWGWEVKVVVTVFESEKCIGPDGQMLEGEGEERIMRRQPGGSEMEEG